MPFVVFGFRSEVHFHDCEISDLSVLHSCVWSGGLARKRDGTRVEDFNMPAFLLIRTKVLRRIALKDC